MIFEIIQELGADRSRLYKEAILKREVNNELLKRAFRYALDPFKQFWIRKIPKYTTPNKPFSDLAYALDQLDQLHTREFTGNAGIEHLKSILSSLDAGDAKVVELIVAKDMACGVSIGTIDKIWPGLVKTYPVMLASAFDQKLMDKLTYPVLVQQKLDGLRFNAIVRDGKVSYYSRNGRTIELNGELEKEFIELASGRNVVFDGELVFMDTDWYQYRDRKTGNGLGNKAIKGTLSAKDAQYACVELWDVISLDDFEAGFCAVPYSTRFGELSCAVALLNQTPSRIRVAHTESAENQDQILEIYSKHLSYGHEGVIVKEHKLTWQPDRVKNQIKLKNESVCELRVVGIQPGAGKYEGMIGALLCESEDGVIKVAVGSGLKDDQRLIDVYTGKIISVKYNERITNKAGDQSLFLPIFHQLREDKDVADMSTMIK